MLRENQVSIRKWLLFVFLFSLTANTFGQKFVQLEKVGSLKVRKYYIGDELTFQLGDDKYWYTETIQDIHVEEGVVLFTNRVIRPDKISAIMSYRNRRWSHSIGNTLYLFGIAWGGFSLLGPLAGSPITSLAAIVPAVAFATGFIIQKLFKSKKLKLGKKRRLRLLDLTFSQP